MTLKELSQLYYLRREIKEEEERAVRLHELATSTTVQIGGTPPGNVRSDKTALAVDIADCEAQVERLKTEYAAEYKRLYSYIEGIDDSLTRQIFRARFVDCLCWEDVAARVGGSAYSVKKTCYRYINGHT